MPIKPSDVTAYHLYSGGLDSVLAAKILQLQGIRVICLNFKTYFFGLDNPKEDEEKYGITIQTVDISGEYQQILENPRYGYGKNANPCVDCHGLMMKIACEMASDNMPAFVSSGEVLNQRPKSQSLVGLHSVTKICGKRELVVRPLCQIHLPESVPEKNGWVDRSRLLGITGRGRKAQIALAEKLGITDYRAPAGGCCLTKIGFAIKVKDMLEHPGIAGLQIDQNNVELLKIGKHIRYRNCKIIVGRKEEQNILIQKLRRPEDRIFRLKGLKGPTAVLRGEITEDSCIAAAYFVKKYSRYSQDEVVIMDSDGNEYDGAAGDFLNEAYRLAEEE